ERAIVVRQRFTRAELHLLESTLATKRERVFGDVDTLRIAKLRKHQKVRTRAATNVEYARATIGHTAANVLDETREDLAATGIPPVRLLDAEHDWICVFLHRRPRIRRIN